MKAYDLKTNGNSCTLGFAPKKTVRRLRSYYILFLSLNT